MRYSLVMLAALSVLPMQVAAEQTPLSAQPPQLIEASGSAMEFGGSVRLRYEVKQDFGFGSTAASNTQDYWLSQLRFYMKWQASDKVNVHLEAQDARIHQAFSDHSISNTSTPNIFEDQLDIHQAYVDVHLNGGDSTLRIGRQKLNIAAQRLIASLEWVNTARVWDGLRWTSHFADNQHTVDVFITQLVPVNPTAANNHDTTGSRMFNSHFNGIYYTNTSWLADLQSEVYLLQRQESMAQDDIQTLGIRLAYQQGDYDADMEWMNQSGEFGGMNHQASAYHLGAGMKLKALATHVGIAYNFASGDSDATDNQHQTFDNLYPLNHAYYGFMDFFSLQNMRNAELVAKTKLSKNLVLRTAWQGFWLDEEDNDAWYNAGAKAVRQATTDVASDVGQEIDITLIYKLPKQKMKLVAGYSRFFSGDYIKQTGVSSAEADFLFVQSKWSF
ncbi:MAG: alginate export family protein [Mariprofundaceae bacterium]|nr:alginate export family protein [Mariprofundaceae bacterium]